MFDFLIIGIILPRLIHNIKLINTASQINYLKHLFTMLPYNASDKRTFLVNCGYSANIVLSQIRSFQGKVLRVAKIQAFLRFIIYQTTRHNKQVVIHNFLKYLKV